LTSFSLIRSRTLVTPSAMMVSSCVWTVRECSY